MEWKFEKKVAPSPAKFAFRGNGRQVFLRWAAGNLNAAVTALAAHEAPRMRPTLLPTWRL